MTNRFQVDEWDVRRIVGGSTRHRIAIQDNDFGYDAALELSGDFSGESKIKYAEAVCKALNAVSDSIPTRPDPPDHVA